MIKQKNISDLIEKIWIPRDYIKTEWEKHMVSPLPILLVGPARSGKHYYVDHKYQDENLIWNDISETDRNELRKDPTCVAGVFIYFPDYKAIQSRTMFFYRLQKDILSQLSKLIFSDCKDLSGAFEERTGYLTESALNFFTTLNELFQNNDFFYQGRINVYLCGIQYIFPEIQRFFLEYLRAFVDTVSGKAELERFKLILTSLRDGYHLTNVLGDIYSPLACVDRIYLKDFSKKEFNEFVMRVKEKAGLEIEDFSYLYSTTNGDIYFAKVISSFCEANAIISWDDIKKKTKAIRNTLIDRAVEYILSPDVLEFIPPFRFLKSFIDQYDEVRDVLYTLNAGTDMAPMMDTTGVYTIPESSGAVIKIEKDGKYGYIFRNEIYRRFVEKYIKEEDKKVESIISDSIGKGDLSFPATLASAIRHEISGPIEAISLELEFLLGLPSISPKIVEYLETIQAANIRLSTINSFLEGLWSPQTVLRRIKINSYIEETISVFKPHLSNRRIKIHFDFDKKIGSFEINTSALRIALINLIINARDAILPKEEGIITISTKLINKNNIELTVKDDGRGMDKYTIQNVMNYGFSTKNEGRGIGLTICKTAVRNLDAKLKIESKEGHGTTVTIAFRRK